jgi:acetyl-CoA/propionyl-CoA carboxylase carboxyl transferase subunit
MSSVTNRPPAGSNGHEVAQRDYRDPLFRLTQLFDRGSIEPLHAVDSSGVLAVRGRIGGRPAFAYCTDATSMGGAMGADGCRNIVTAIDTAVVERAAVVGLWHSGGARLADGVESMEAVGRVFAAMTRASGKVPQLSVVLGPAAGAAAYGPALTDLVIMSSSGRMFITGPDVVKAVTGQQIEMQALGGPDVHLRRSGVAHLAVDSEEAAYRCARRVVDLLVRPGLLDLGTVHDGEDLRRLLPPTSRRAYDIRPLVRGILDSGGTILDSDASQPDETADTEFLELQKRWAPNMVIGLGRLAGRAVGVIANNPLRKGGCLDSLSAEKASRFVRMCNSLGLPMLVIVDVPGYLPGVTEEWDGVIRRGAKLLYAFADATVPRVTLVVRKSYGGAYIAMNSRSLGATAVLAWPEAEVAVMSAEAAVGILYRKQLAAAAPSERQELRQRLVGEHTRTSGGVSRAVALGAVDEVIEPTQTRRRLAEALAMAPAGRGHHGNIPL